MVFFKRQKAEPSGPTEPPKERHGIFFLHELPNPNIDVVAVHGLGGHFEETWADNHSQQLWLRDFLPSQLEDVGIVARLMSYGYDSTTAFSKSVTDVKDQATMLLDALYSERLSPLEKTRPLIFIAHSLGGIIVKKVLIIAHERSSIYGTVLDSVHGLVFFGVPHRGSDLAYWATFAARLFETVQLGLGTNKSFVEALQRNSQTFADISQSFVERATRLKIRTFYETEKLHGNLIVDEDSARLGLPNEIPVGVAAADHKTICKFNNKDSPRYRPVWKAIRELCAETRKDTASTRKQQESLFLVPFSRDPHFLGRQDIIDLVEDKLEIERRVALTGIGGVGKSQIAIEYCYRFRDRHADSDVFWVHAGTKERFEQAFKAIARQRKLSGWDDPATSPLDLVYEWLRGSNTWLMILDNADDKDVFFDQRPTTTSQNPEAQRSTVPLVKYIPQTSPGGSILITSRNRDAAFRLTNSVKKLIDVPYMSKEDAVALLCKKLSDDKSSDSEKFELVELLECLPLAITQAASYISVNRIRMTIAEYSTYLRENEKILLDDMGDLQRDPTVPSSILLTWRISFDQINEKDRPAAELLSLMSLFDRQGIPESLLRKESEDDLDFGNRWAPLEKFSFVICEEGGRSFQMHRLVQMAIRSWLEQHGDIDRWKQKAVQTIAGSLPSFEHRFWKTWEILLPHSEVALDYVFPSSDSQILHVRILSRTAQYFVKRGKYTAAWERCQCALDTSLGLSGEDSIWVALCFTLRAALMQITHYEYGLGIGEAEISSRKAVGIFEQVEEKGTRESIAASELLATILLDTGDDEKIKEATEILESTVASSKQTFGLEDRRTLMSMKNLARALSKVHKHKEAEQLERKMVEIMLRVLGEKDFDTMSSMNNFTDTLVSQERYEEAQEFAQRGLDSSTANFGEEHPHTLLAMRTLSITLMHQGKGEEAEVLCRKALALHETAIGEDAYKTTEYTRLLAQILEKQHKYKEADEVCRHSLVFSLTSFGPDHFQTTSARTDLCLSLYSHGEYDQAEELFREDYNSRPAWWDGKIWDYFLWVFADTLAKLGKHDEAAKISLQIVRLEDADTVFRKWSAHQGSYR